MDRLNKYLAHAGVGSRRHCDTLIAAGAVAAGRLRGYDGHAAPTLEPPHVRRTRPGPGHTR